MKLTWASNSLTIQREPGDPKFYGNLAAAGESALLYFLKKHLNRQGYDLIKKRMDKDGHMVSQYQQYLRSRARRGRAIMIYSPIFAIKGISEPWNDGTPVTLQVVRDIWRNITIKMGNRESGAII